MGAIFISYVLPSMHNDPMGRPLEDLAALALQGRPFGRKRRKYYNTGGEEESESDSHSLMSEESSILPSDDDTISRHSAMTEDSVPLSPDTPSEIV